jgi:DNA-binding GntR family transcriptional regulator
MAFIPRIPAYRKVYEMLRRHIQDEVYKQGTLLPSENDLCQLYHVTRPTIRKSLDVLVNEGYIKKHQGKGSVVMGLPKGIGILSIAGTTSAIGQQNLKTRIIVEPQVRNWSSAFTFSLTEREKELGCIYLERLRYVNDNPVFFDITMIPNVNLPRFTSRSFENKSLFDILRKYYQIEIRGGEQQIMARNADKTLQKYFRVPKNHPVLQLNRRMETNRVDFYVYSQVFCKTDDYVLYGRF